MRVRWTMRWMSIIRSFERVSCTCRGWTVSSGVMMVSLCDDWLVSSPATSTPSSISPSTPTASPSTSSPPAPTLPNALSLATLPTTLTPYHQTTHLTTCPQLTRFTESSRKKCGDDRAALMSATAENHKN